MATKDELSAIYNKAYQESDSVKAAKTALDTALAAKPAEYQSQYQTQLSNYLNDILNRKKFSYDVSGDALYGMYKDKYTQAGKQAMNDTIGKAATMTGGYGNSYAQTAGQQQYNQYMTELTDKIPELYEMAYNRYQDEGDELYNKYNLLNTQENQDYSRWQDNYNNWLTDRDYYNTAYDNERNYDYNLYSDARDFAYQSYRDMVSDDQWQQEFNASQSSGSSGGSSGGGSSSSSSSSSSKGTLNTTGINLLKQQMLAKANAGANYATIANFYVTAANQYSNSSTIKDICGSYMNSTINEAIRAYKRNKASQ